MIILGIDTATKYGSIALAKDQKIIAEQTILWETTHSETLLPSIKYLLDATGVSKNDLSAVAITQGPGSFTGLRIGLATAKGLCVASKIPLLTTTTLHSLAYNIIPTEQPLCVAITAGRGLVYFAEFSSNRTIRQKPQLCTIQHMLSSLTEDTLLIWKEYSLYKQLIKESCSFTLFPVPPHLEIPRASSLIHYCIKQNPNLTFDSHAIAAIHPLYLQQSAAEIQFDKRYLNHKKH